jgi:hypothetical protein
MGFIVSSEDNYRVGERMMMMMMIMMMTTMIMMMMMVRFLKEIQRC